MDLQQEQDTPRKAPKKTMARKASTLAKKSAVTVCSVLALYALFIIFHSSSHDPTPLPSDPIITTSTKIRLRTTHSPAVKIYLYDLPRRFTYGVIAHHSLARGHIPAESPDDVTKISYPGHQHMAEWHLFKDLTLRLDPDRSASPVVRVDDPDEADLFYVPFFSSLSVIVNRAEAERAYSDEEAQEELLRWLQGQEYWRRNNGRDHVIPASDPNALRRVVDRVKNSVLLVSDFGRLRGDQGSLVKDVVLPYSHRISDFKGDVGIRHRPALLFFMGARFRKEGGKIRNLLFELLENEEDVVMKNGVQSRESRRAASLGMHTSKFCLNPAGDTPSACRLFDSVISLCVPVIISDDIELPFEDVIDYGKIAIFVETSVALNPGYLVSMLRGISDERIVEYQKELKAVKLYFEYGKETVNEIWRQVAQKLPLIKLMINRDKRLLKTNLSEPDCSCLCSNRTATVTRF